MDALEALLLEWDCLEVLPVLKENKVTVERLKYLSTDDIKEMIPLIGLRAEFREKLLLWKNQKSPSDEQNFLANYSINYSANASTTSKVSNWMEQNINTNTNSINSFSVDVIGLLSESRKGQGIQKFYKDNNFLLDTHRNDMISIIVDAALEKDIKLHAKDFLHITRQILTAFPTESEDYYYIPRQKRKNSKNPGGKMYDKFYNLSNKKKRRNISSSITATNAGSQNIKQEEEIDFEDEGLLKIKLTLQNNINAVWCYETEPPSISDIWKNTFQLRRKDLEASIASDFANQWPAYKQILGYKLFNYDFSILYPGKENALFEKWHEFQRLIYEYYDENIKNKNSREEFAVCRRISNQESVNYLLAKLLNSIMIPTGRFYAKHGEKATRKYTISDSDECFAVHLTDIKQSDLKLQEIRDKHYIASSLQPIMIVVGIDIYTLYEFYIFFDGFLYQFENFLKCLSTCFQIFKVLNLSFPKACQNAWIFIQRYFYSLDDHFEYVPSVSSVLSYFQRDNIAMD